MIRYALRCECGHAFDGWFQSSNAYENQHQRKLVSCPACNSANVEKAIMAPRLTRKSTRSSPTVPTTQPAAQDAESFMMAPQQREILAKLRELRNEVTKNADNVGDKFSDEARKMHYGDIEHRPIYGDASAEDAKSLMEEGIEIMPLPVLPDDRN